VYDVLYMDRTKGSKTLATGLDREDACAVARTEARRLGVGRMFLAGSEIGPPGGVVVIVESRRSAA
jgi:hypothetical protein